MLQEHRARRLHYDLRLELDGVLKSWAIPKGPSLDPTQKRLAVEVEDHPLDYADYQGVIPAGEYGAGTVLLWDRGTWRPQGDPHQSLRDGRLKFQLQGKKLRGSWVLVRRNGSRPKGDKHWLLIRQRDEDARLDADEHLLEEDSTSAMSAGTREAIPPRHRKRRHGRPSAAQSDTLPRHYRPQLATLAQAAPEGNQWWHEVKLDGYRMGCRIDPGQVAFLSRNRQPWADRLPHLVSAANRLPVRQAFLDGELVFLQADGTTNFHALQGALQQGQNHRLVYLAFDLLHLDGKDLSAAPLCDRKAALAELFSGDVGRPRLLGYLEHVAGHGRECFQQACRLGAEGIISKRWDRPSIPGRSADWLKIKCVQREEFVLGGFTEPAKTRFGLGALLLGYYNSGAKLQYAGKVGTGFSDRMLRELHERLQRLEQEQSPFDTTGMDSSSLRRVHWVRPRLVGQVQFGGWTAEGRLRHPSFQGLREDKRAEEVVRESPLRPHAKDDAPAVSPSSRSKQKVAGVVLTHPDKVLYREQGISKRALADYYRSVAEWTLPHVAGRPLVLVRCPEGYDGKCFFQKHPGLGVPAPLRQIAVKEHEQTEHYLVVDGAAGLVALVQMGALEIHTWGSREDNPDRPDRLIFDLDPDPAVPWPRVVESAHQLRQFLRDLGLESFVKTTGGKGLHVVVPVGRRHSWEEVRAFCKDVARAAAAADPLRYTASLSKAARRERIFIDYLRNQRGATSVAPYSTRARRGATVSVPIAWDELSEALPSDGFTITNVPTRLAGLREDPWATMRSTRQSITAAAKRRLKQ